MELRARLRRKASSGAAIGDIQVALGARSSRTLPHMARWLLLAFLTGLSASCFTFVSFEGGGGSATTSSTTGTGGGVVYPCGGPKTKGCDDPGCPGVCELEAFDLPEDLTTGMPVLAQDVLGFQTAGGRRTVIRGGTPSTLFIFSEDLTSVAPWAEVNPATDPGGLVLGGATLAYAPVAPLVGCDGPCLWFGGGPTGIECLGRGSGGAAVLGAVSGLARVDGAGVEHLYFTTKESHQIFELADPLCGTSDPMTCGGAAETCVASPIVADMSRDGMTDVAKVTNRLEYDGDRLWWSTDRGCVYSASPNDAPLASVSCTVPNSEFVSQFQPPTIGPSALTASKGGVFVATVLSDGGKGPIYLVSRQSKTAAPIEASSVRAPFASDGNLLYAVDDALGKVFVVDRAGKLYAKTSTLETSGWLTIDATDPTYVYFATNTKLYRWRKPDPCTVDPTKARCGDGCIDFDSPEECDDGNGADDDGCSGACKIE